MEIRVARPEEFDAIGRLTVDAYAGLAGMGPLGAYGDELADVAGRGSHGVVLVAAQGAELLGDVTYYRRYADEVTSLGDALGDLAGFRMLATAVSAQGRGVGAALTAACVQRARDEGASGVALHTTDLMTTAQRLYRRLGFSRCEPLDLRFGRTKVTRVLAYRLLFEDRAG